MTHKLTTQDAQQRIDDKFGKDFITILDFEGVDRPCKVLHNELGTFEISRFSGITRKESRDEVLSLLNNKLTHHRKLSLEEAQAKLDAVYPENELKIVKFEGVNREVLVELAGKRYRHPRYANMLKFETYGLLKRHLLSLDESNKSYDEIESGPVMILHSSNDPLPADEYVYLPFYKDIQFAAGSGAFAQDDYNGYKLPFGKSTLYRCGIQPSQAACFTVKGDSMEPAMPSGATIGVNLKEKVIRNGQVYAFLNEGNLRVKVLYTENDGNIRMHSYNDAYPDEFCSPNEVDIIGKVFWWSVLL